MEQNSVEMFKVYCKEIIDMKNVHGIILNAGSRYTVLFI